MNKTNKSDPEISQLRQLMRLKHSELREGEEGKKRGNRQNVSTFWLISKSMINRLSGLSSGTAIDAFWFRLFSVYSLFALFGFLTHANIENLLWYTIYNICTLFHLLYDVYQINTNIFEWFENKRFIGQMLEILDVRIDFSMKSSHICHDWFNRRKRFFSLIKRDTHEI